jgi:hypothetical protein
VDEALLCAQCLALLQHLNFGALSGQFVLQSLCLQLQFAFARQFSRDELIGSIAARRARRR